MQLRVADQIESERRAVLAAGRRRIEREVAARLAGEQSASLEQQQVWTVSGQLTVLSPWLLCQASHWHLCKEH